jgi:MFS family permease
MGAIIGGFTVGIFVPKGVIAGGSEVIFYFFIIGMIVNLISLVPLRYIAEDVSLREHVERRSMFRVENPRKVYLLMAVLGFAVFGTVVAGSVMPVYIGNVLNHTTTEVGIVASTASIGGLIAAPLSGYVAERFNRKRVILVAVVTYFVLWGIWSMTTDIVILALLWSIPVFSFLYIPACSLVADWTSKGSRGKGLGLLSSAVGASQFIAALAGGALIQSLGGDLDAFIFTFRLSLIFIVVGFVLALLLPGEKKDGRHQD